MCEIAEKEKNTTMLGRTHGQAAVPITFGLKVAVWIDEFRRHLDRLEEMTTKMHNWKVSRAVGTGAAQGDRALELQELVREPRSPCCNHASSWQGQVHRVGGLDTNVSTTVEKVLQEIRNLQRTENW